MDVIIKIIITIKIMMNYKIDLIVKREIRKDKIIDLTSFH